MYPSPFTVNYCSPLPLVFVDSDLCSAVQPSSTGNDAYDFPVSYATLRNHTMYSKANGLQGQSLTSDFVLNCRYHHIIDVFVML